MKYWAIIEIRNRIIRTKITEVIAICIVLNIWKLAIDEIKQPLLNWFHPLINFRGIQNNKY